MTRRMGLLLLVVVMSLLGTAVSEASPAHQRSEPGAKLSDPNNDVKFDEGNRGGKLLKGDWGGDIRTVKAAVQDKRVLVKVAFDHIQYTPERLSIAVSFPAGRDGISYIASMVGNTSTGDPVESLVQLLSGSDETDPVDCSGFQTGIGKDEWIFSVPKTCLEPQNFTSKSMVVKTEYVYDNGVSYDRFPNSGKTRIK